MHKAIGQGEMDVYRLDYVLHPPQESEGGMYVAEVPDLQGCMAWGDTPAETLHELLDVARMLIAIRKERGEPIPTALMAPSPHKGSLTVTA